MKPFNPHLVVVAIATLVAAGCDPVGTESGRGEARPRVAPPTLSPVEILPPTVDRQTTGRVEVRDPLAIASTQVDAFKQSDGVVDILWIIDDSGSMKNQRQTLTDNFERFIQELLALQVNFQIGVISSNAVDGAVLRGNTKIINNLTPDPQQVFVENTTFPDSRTRWEQGLRMMQLALSAPNINGPNQGFMRPNAALAVIAVTDEDDGSWGETAYYARWLRGAKGKGNENLVSFSVIGGTTPNGCYPPGESIYYGGLADPAFRYAAVASRTGGVVGSICNSSFETTLVQIAQALNTLRRIFPLSLTPDPATLYVTVNGVVIPRNVVTGWQYREETRSIAFVGNYVPPPGSTVRIEYVISE